ncbi:MAG: hypothetical protein ACRCX2_06570 [Paraclostridium sp.]
MLQQDKIIRSALRLIGYTYGYNDNNSDTYKLANDILGDLINTVASRTDLLFNSVTVKLTSIGLNDLGENRFNIPIDFLNKIRFLDSNRAWVNARIENEFIYSEVDEVHLQYCRKINLNEYPDYLFELMVLLLALKIAESDLTFQDKINLIDTRLDQELQRIYSLEFQPKTRGY